MPLDLQFYTLFVMIITGIAAGLVFDFFRALRTVTAARGLAAELWDLMFWVALTVVVAAGLVLGNWGNLRVAVLLGGFVGLWLYLELASDIMLVGMERAFRLMGSVCRFLADVVITGILLPVELLVVVLDWALAALLAVLMPLGRFLAWLVEPLWYAVYPWLEPKLGYYKHRVGPYIYWLSSLLK